MNNVDNTREQNMMNNAVGEYVPQNVANNSEAKTKTTSTNRKKTKKSAMEQIFSPNNIRKGLKRSAGFAGSLLINLIIVFLIIKIFSYAFNFTYSVFGDVCKTPGDREYVVVEIPPDSSILEIGQALEDNEIIDDKYVFFAKVKVKGYGDKIKTGKFGLSASMNYDEILEVICDLDTGEEE